MTTANNQNDAYNGANAGGGPTPTDLGKAATINGDTPDYLNQKIYAVNGVHVETTNAGPGFYALLLRGNYTAGANVAITATGGAEDPLRIDFTPPAVVESGKVKTDLSDTAGYTQDKILAKNGAKITTIIDSPTVQHLQVEGNYSAGANITLIPGALPTDPIAITSTPGPSTSNFGIISMPLASCRGAIGIPGIGNGGGSVLATLTAIPASFICNKLECFVKQIGSGLCVMALYDINGVMLGKTATWAPSVIGFKSMPIAFDSANNPISSVSLVGATGIYFALWGNSSANGAQFYSMDAGITFGPSPWIGWVKDNAPNIPVTMVGGSSESSQRFSISAKA